MSFQPQSFVRQGAISLFDAMAGMAGSTMSAAIEAVLNRLIQDDPMLVKQLARLKGRVIQVHIRELKQTFTFVMSQRIDVLMQYEGQADCYLSVAIQTLPQLKDQSRITQLIKQDDLVLEGDIQLAQKFSQLLTDCRPDWEELLSRWTGDVVAHQVVQGAKTVESHFRQSYLRHQSHLALVVTEEWKLAPSALEVAHFCDQVDDMVSQFARLEAKLHALSGHESLKKP